MRIDGQRFWVSPGARIGFVVIACFMALVISIGVIPGIQERSRNRTRDRLEQVQKAQQQKAGQELLHNFDCTFGVAIKAILAEAERSYRVQAHNALISRHAQLAVGNRRAANAAYRARLNALRAMNRYHVLGLRIKPLAGTPGHRMPCK